MLNLRQSDIEFIQKNISKESELLKTDDVNTFLDILDDWINENGFAPPEYYDYNDLGREAQKVYDYVYLNC